MAKHKYIENNLSTLDLESIKKMFGEAEARCNELFDTNNPPSVDDFKKQRTELIDLYTEIISGCDILIESGMREVNLYPMRAIGTRKLYRFLGDNRLTRKDVINRYLDAIVASMSENTRMMWEDLTEFCNNESKFFSVRDEISSGIGNNHSIFDRASELTKLFLMPLANVKVDNIHLLIELGGLLRYNGEFEKAIVAPFDVLIGFCKACGNEFRVIRTHDVPEGEGNPDKWIKGYQEKVLKMIYRNTIPES